MSLQQRLANLQRKRMYEERVEELRSHIVTISTLLYSKDISLKTLKKIIQLLEKD